MDRNRQRLPANTWRDYFVPLFWVSGFFAYQLFIIVMVATGQGETTFYSIIYRAIFLGMSLVMIWQVWWRDKFPIPERLMVMGVTFLVLYTLRIILDSYEGAIEGADYFARVHGAAFIPMAAFAYALTAKQGRWSFNLLYVFSAAAVLLCLYFYRDYLGGGYRTVRYMKGIDTKSLISPHFLSYNGAALCALSLWAVICKKALFPPWARIAFYLLLIPGSALMLFGGSRGAILALLVVLGFILITQRSEWLGKVLRIGTALMLLGIGIYFFSEGVANRIKNLFTEVSEGDQEAGAGRSEIWQGAWDQFMASPILGSGAVEQTSKTFPHNHFLEAFMATGIVGGICFLGLQFYAIRASGRLLRASSDLGWIAILYIFSLGQGLISFPIYRSELWFGTVAVIAAEGHRRRLLRKKHLARSNDVRHSPANAAHEPITR